MKKYCWAAVLLLSLFDTAHAQVPGFVGKRFMVFLDGNPTPAFFVANANNASIWDSGGGKAKRFAFTFRPQATVEYLLGRNFGLGFSYSRLRVGTQRKYQISENAPEILDYDVLKGQSIGVHFKFYDFKRSASIAPIGYYRTISVYLTQTNTYDTKASNVKQFKNDFVYPVVTAAIGRQTMVARGLLLKTGVEFGWTFVPLNWNGSSHNWDLQQYAGYKAHENLFMDYFFTINVGLGYTLF